MEFDGVSQQMLIHHSMDKWGFTCGILAYPITNTGFVIGPGANSSNAWSLSIYRDLVTNRQRRDTQIANNPSGGGGNGTILGPPLHGSVGSVHVWGEVTSTRTTWDYKEGAFPNLTGVPAHNPAIVPIRVGTARATSLFSNCDISQVLLFGRVLSELEQVKLLQWLEAQHVS